MKKNWYGNKQLRFFKLYSTGEILYYKDMTEYRGTIVIGAKTQVIKSKNNLEFHLKNCVKSNKNKDEYVLV